jgi:hypothetical protein
MSAPATFFLLLFAAAVQGAGSGESVGDWSSEHQHLRARFVGRYTSSSLEGKPGGPYSEFLIYLELHNTSPALSTMQLKLDMDAATNITYRVTDERGSVIEPERAVFRSTFAPGTYNLVLPPDGMLRFPISLNGGGVFEDKAKLDVSPRQGIWYFDKNLGRELNLSGTLKIPELRGRYGSLWWRGELEIPPVKLTIPGAKAHGAAPNAAVPARLAERLCENPRFFTVALELWRDKPDTRVRIRWFATGVLRRRAKGVSFGRDDDRVVEDVPRRETKGDARDLRGSET